MPKKILFVINTLGRAGAETALISLLKKLDSPEYDLSLFVLTGQGEMACDLPEYVHLLNRRYHPDSVLDTKGRIRLSSTVIRSLFANGEMGKKITDLARICRSQKSFCPDKALWRMVSDGAERLEETFDLAVAFLEGGSTYYVADHVHAEKKAAFVHIDYESSGYTREMDRDCYEKMDRIFAVSEETKTHFLACYPEYRKKTFVFPNFLDRETVLEKAEMSGGFSDSFDGLRILTVGRLTYQKGYDIAVRAMKIIRESGLNARWYVLGEGDQRKALEREIAKYGLQKDFILPGAVDNPYPYYAQADLYVHATRFEGKSIAIQEAQILGCPVIVSDCGGNREQIQDGVDGIFCRLDPVSIAGAVIALAENPEFLTYLGKNAKQKNQEKEADLWTLLALTED